MATGSRSIDSLGAAGPGGAVGVPVDSGGRVGDAAKHPGIPIHRRKLHAGRAGFHPLPLRAGLAVLCAYVAPALSVAVKQRGT